MLGTDIVEVKRINKAIKNEKFLNRVFTKNEIEYAKKFKDYASHFAGFFCAKEAVMKALENCDKISFLDIEVLHNDTGKPYAKLEGYAKEIFAKKGFANIDISISQTKKYATAVCILF